MVGLCKILLNTVMSLISFGHEVVNEIVSLNTAKKLFQNQRRLIWEFQNQRTWEANPNLK